MNLETKDIIKEEIEHKIKSCSNEIQDYLEIELNKSKETLLNQWLEITRLSNRIDKAIEYIENKTEKVKYKEIGITEKRLCLIHNQVDYLLDILKGSDKE